MKNSHGRTGRHAAEAILDEGAVIAVLSRHFPGARRETVRRAAEDVLLLELLARDVGLVWEDALRDEPGRPDLDTVTAFDVALPRGS